MDDFYLACDLAYSDGRVKRFGVDERDDADIPQSISFDTSQPGGFATASVVLPRPPRMRADDAALFAEARFYGPGSRTYYEGRVTGLPQVGADSIRLDLEGHSAALDDDETFRAIIIDRDLSHWGSPSLRLRQNRIEAGYDLTDASVTWDSTGLALAQEFEGPKDTRRNLIESMYDIGPGIGIDSVDYTWHQVATAYSDPNYYWRMAYSFTDGLDSPVYSANFRGAGPSVGNFDCAGSRYVYAQHFYDSAPLLEGTYAVYWTFAVVGQTGIPTYLTEDGLSGVRGSDVIAYILNQSVPSLNYHLGDSIEQSTYVIPHLIFAEEVTPAEAIRQITALGGANLLPNDWGCYQNKEFFWKTPGTYGRTWRVRRDQTATPTTEGPQSKSRIAGMKISYRDGAGSVHSVGPPNSGSEYETTDLLDTDLSNPATRLSRRFAHRQVGITNQEGALNIGRLLLANANRSGWQGDVEIVGTATDFAGNEYPACEIKAGDRIVIEDDEAPEERPVNSTSYSHDTMKLTAHVGELPDSGEVLLAQLVAATDLVSA